jgi:hypothetical protein
MKKKSLLKKLQWLLDTTSDYYSDKAASLALLNQLYSKPWPGDTVPDGYTSIVIKISPEGSLFRVWQQYFLKGELQREYSWLASFSEQHNTTLSEIGGYRYIIFDAVRGLLYLEDEAIAGLPTVAIYHSIPTLLP